MSLHALHSSSVGISCCSCCCCGGGGGTSGNCCDSRVVVVVVVVVVVLVVVVWWYLFVVALIVVVIIVIHIYLHVHKMVMCVVYRFLLDPNRLGDILILCVCDNKWNILFFHYLLV